MVDDSLRINRLGASHNRANCRLFFGNGRALRIHVLRIPESLAQKFRLVLFKAALELFVTISDLSIDFSRERQLDGLVDVGGRLGPTQFDGRLLLQCVLLLFEKRVDLISMLRPAIIRVNYSDPVIKNWL